MPRQCPPLEAGTISRLPGAYVWRRRSFAEQDTQYNSPSTRCPTDLYPFHVQSAGRRPRLFRHSARFGFVALGLLTFMHRGRLGRALGRGFVRLQALADVHIALHRRHLNRSVYICDLVLRPGSRDGNDPDAVDADAHRSRSSYRHAAVFKRERVSVVGHQRFCLNQC